MFVSFEFCARLDYLIKLIMDSNEDGGIETDPQIDCPLTTEEDVRLLDLERNFFETSTAVLMNGRKLHSLYEHIIKEVLVIERDKNLDTVSELEPMQTSSSYT